MVAAVGSGGSGTWNGVSGSSSAISPGANSIVIAAFSARQTQSADPTVTASAGSPTVTKIAGPIVGSSNNELYIYKLEFGSSPGSITVDITNATNSRCAFTVQAFNAYDGTPQNNTNVFNSSVQNFNTGSVTFTADNAAVSMATDAQDAGQEWGTSSDTPSGFTQGPSTGSGGPNNQRTTSSLAYDLVVAGGALNPLWDDGSNFHGSPGSGCTLEISDEVAAPAPAAPARQPVITQTWL